MIHPSADAMAKLFSRARDSLTDAELADLSSLPDAANFDLRNLSRVCGALASLIAADDGEHESGIFRADPSELFALLAHIASTADACAGMIAVGDDAGALLASRKAERAKS